MAPVAKVLITLAICVCLSTLTSGVSLPATRGRGAIIEMDKSLELLPRLVSSPKAPLSSRAVGATLLGSFLSKVGNNGSLLSRVKSIASGLCIGVARLAVVVLPMDAETVDDREVGCAVCLLSTSVDVDDELTCADEHECVAKVDDEPTSVDDALAAVDDAGGVLRTLVPYLAALDSKDLSIGNPGCRTASLATRLRAADLVGGVRCAAFLAVGVPVLCTVVVDIPAGICAVALDLLGTGDFLPFAFAPGLSLPTTDACAVARGLLATGEFLPFAFAMGLFLPTDVCAVAQGLPALVASVPFAVAWGLERTLSA